MRQQQDISHYDVLIIGGGVNGVGIARDAAGRGLRVCLAEMHDLASATSSWSTKLIHGGLRYLESYEFKLVRESLIEREILLNAAPHLIEPLRFILPHHAGLRPAWLLRLGLFLYDHIGGRRLLPATQKITLPGSAYGAPLKSDFKHGFEYSDCRVDDARLVLANAMDAAARGADICLRTKVVAAARVDGVWRVRLEAGGEIRDVMAKTLVNAAGPWVTQLYEAIDGVTPTKKLRLVKGSHLFVKAHYAHDRAYIFQHADGRIVFAIPYRHDLTLIGTTDEPYDGNPADAKISDDEISYLCDLVSEYFNQPITPSDVVSTYSGVRPLFDELGKGDASKVTRDYAFEVQDQNGTAPFLAIYGGKLTTYRKLALDALKSLQPYLPTMGPEWTKTARLPGGEMGYQGFAAFIDEIKRSYPFLPDEMVQRLCTSYGSAVRQILGNAKALADLGTHFGADLYAAELEHMRQCEWAHTAEDALTRRSKLYLKLSEAEQQKVADWFTSAVEDHAVAERTPATAG
ncbi:MAG: glycerol-3-phosphate dehydrogenase [Pseudomonadota bacterium]